MKLINTNSSTVDLQWSHLGFSQGKAKKFFIMQVELQHMLDSHLVNKISKKKELANIVAQLLDLIKIWAIKDRLLNQISVLRKGYSK